MNKSKTTILITGVAGFIGGALAEKLVKEGFDVLGIDNLNNYYSIELKKSRLKKIERLSLSSLNWNFYNTGIQNSSQINDIFDKHNPKIVINLAAQAGVRYSIENPDVYITSNLNGFYNILECSRKYNIEHFIFASSSSVYGLNRSVPFKEKDSVDHPISLYAATKKSNELLAHSYSHLYSLPTTGLRFFTVYGPYGRPDMAPMIFAKSIMEGIPIKIFNFGKMKRDFTFIDDVVKAIYLCCFKVPKSNNEFDFENPFPDISSAPYRIFNVGNSQSIELMRFINLLENNLGKKAIKDFNPLQKGDVINTYADNNSLLNWVGFKPSMPIEEGLKIFADWYKDYFKS